MNQAERRIITVTCFGHFLSHFNMLVFPAVVLPLTSRLNLDLAAVLGFSVWQYALFGLTALPWGLAADRWGPKPFMMLYFLGAGSCGAAAALLMDSPTGFTMALAGIGLFSGIYHPSALGLISKGFRDVSLGMGYNGMFGNLGLAAAPMITGVANWLWGPPGAYFILAGMNLAGFILMAMLKFDVPEEAPDRPAEGHVSLVGPFLILLAAMMLAGIVYRGGTVILPAYFEMKGQGLYRLLSSLAPAGLSANLVATALTSIIYFIGMLGQWAGGRVGSRFEARRSYLLFHALALPPLFLMTFTSDLLLFGLALAYFFVFLGSQPIENTLVARLTPRKFHHSAFGLKFVLTFGVGAVAVKLVGWIERTYGLKMIFPSLGLISLLLIGSIVFLMARTSPVQPSGLRNQHLT